MRSLGPLALLGFAVACGGSTSRDPGAGGGGRAGSPPDLSTAGAGGLFIAVPPDAMTPEPVTCLEPAPSCHIKNTYVQIDDGLPTTLTVPFDEDCASCWVPCEDCSVDCEVSATGEASCGMVKLKVAVCAGPEQTPPCLNTKADEPYYVDAQGRTWSVLSLSGSAEADARPALLEADLELGIRDADVSRALLTHVRVCAELSATLRPCK